MATIVRNRVRTLSRKVQEALMALIVEWRYDKEEILESYLNEIYLGQRGGTAIHEALSLSLEHLGKSDRLKMVLFATDGLPTIGERQPEAILRHVDKANKNDVRIFVFGEGFKFSGNAVIKSNAKGDEKVAISNGVV